MSTLENKTFNTELAMVYSQLPEFPTEDEKELVAALAYLVELGQVSVVYDDSDGEVKFLYNSPEAETLH
jgi:hypothetical protein